MLDLILKNGRIVNGSGSPGFYGDIGIKGNAIIDVGKIDCKSKAVIDVQGKVVCPGFIDVHSHSDLYMLQQPMSEIKIRQGVTTEVFGNCGMSPAPVSPEYAELLSTYIEPIIGRKQRDRHWKTMGEFLEELSGCKFVHNTAALIGNGTLRIAVKGFDTDPLTTEEIAKVRELLEEGLQAGTFGLSLGLMYAPENYYSTEELIFLCNSLKKYQALLTAHIRGEGNSLISSINEVISIAEKAQVPLHISHFKAAGRKNWGRLLDETMDLIEKAIDGGTDVTCDVYPYCAGSTSLSSLFPPWMFEGGIEKALKRLTNVKVRDDIKMELQTDQLEWDNLVCSTGWENVYISSVSKNANQMWMGKSVAEIAVCRNEAPVECALNLFVEDEGKTGIVFFHMSEDDVKKILAWKHSLVASDSIYSMQGIPHPRLYGTFPRLFAKYVRDCKTLTLEQAVRKVTGFPAQRFGLKKRGLLLPGYTADIVVFDLSTISDEASYQNPFQYPKGIDWVLVDGDVVLKSGQYLGKVNGRLIKAR